MTTKKKVTRKKVEGPVVDGATGEIVEGATSVNVVDQDLVIIDSDEYVIIDSQALQYIRDNFNAMDLGRILKMADMTYGEYNVLYNGPIPHTSASLMEDLQYSRNKYANFMKRLEKKSIIYYIVGYTDGKKVKHIMLNPYLARKRKTIHKDCIRSFENIRLEK